MSDNDKNRNHLFIHGLTLPCRVGIHPHEKLTPRILHVDIELELLPGKHAHEDDIDKVVCYDAIHDKACAILGRDHVNLLETVAENIAQACLEDERVIEVSVRMVKAGSMPDADETGISITRTR